MKPKILILTAILGGVQFAHSQGFINLNFESTTLATNGSPGTVSTAVGLPGWNASIGGAQQSTILYNNGTLGSSAIAILGNGNSINPVIDESFSVSLTAGAGGNAAISQTGLVPVNANTIFFDSYAQGYGVPNLSVTLNGQALGVLLYSAGNNYNVYAANVSSFAGQSANLAFTATSNYPQGFEIFVLDDMSFSPTSVPEPGALRLSAVGGLFLAWRRWRIRAI